MKPYNDETRQEEANNKQATRPKTEQDPMRQRPNTYIMRWNPAISSFKWSEYERAISQTGGYFRFNWSIYEYEGAKEGDQYYMVRVGEGETGIMWRGEFTSAPYIAEDWAGTSKPRRYVDMTCLDATLTPHIGMKELEESIPEICWARGHSGEKVSDEVAEKLKEMWKEEVDII